MKSSSRGRAKTMSPSVDETFAAVRVVLSQQTLTAHIYYYLCQMKTALMGRKRYSLLIV